MCSPGRRASFDEARQAARDHGWREKSLIYLTRGRTDLLVLEQPGDFGGVHVQVPAGGVEPGENPEAASRRELFEETGLNLAGPAAYLGSYLWQIEAPSRVRHFYWLEAPADTPDSWSHVVSAGEADAGMLFHLSFRPLDQLNLTIGYGWESALGQLSEVLDTRSPDSKVDSRRT